MGKGQNLTLQVITTLLPSGVIMFRLMLPGEGNILEKMSLYLYFICAPTVGKADFLAKCVTIGPIGQSMYAL
jgi:hypothetical protein